MNKQNIFYYSDGSMITDVSGKKTKEQIANEFSWNIDSIQHIEVDASFESTKVVDGSIVKYNFIEANEQLANEAKAIKEADISSATNKLKALGLTDDEIKAITK